MKTVLLILATLLVSLLYHATTYTCSNDPVGGAQFTNLDDVYSVAVDGDTILLEKSNIPYQLINTSMWDKSLTVIGIGINPNIISDNRCVINVIGPFGQIDAAAAGSRFYGITFNTTLTLFGTNDIIFENCFFGPGNRLRSNFAILSSNILVINTVFEGIDEVNVQLGLDQIENIHFLNCIFNGYINGGGSTDPWTTIDHCMFLNNASNGKFMRQIIGATISNCVFVHSLGGGSLTDGVVNCTFLNNMYSSFVVDEIPPAGNFGSGNFNYTFPDFANFTLGETYSHDHDYTLNPSSVGVGTATDGTDIGVHGGNTNFNEALEPSIVPIVTSILIQGGSIEVGGTINLNVQARKPLPD